MQRSPSRNAGHHRGAQARTLRIIGGRWRGRRLQFPDAEGLRPTPDRVRETLFNWLGPGIAGARCLDLFAGSGALGLEALSRGAARVLFVEQTAAAARDLKATLQEWGGTQGEVRRADALALLAGPAESFDVVFLDPPFAGTLLAEAAPRLAHGGWLAPGALIYAESPARTGLPPLPSSWVLLKAKQAGEVGYHLLRHEP